MKYNKIYAGHVLVFIALFLLGSLELFAGTRFAVMADTHVSTNIAKFTKYEKFIAALDPKPACVLICGDLTDKGSESQLKLFESGKKLFSAVGIPVYVTVGNHELFNKDIGQTYIQNIFEMPKNGPKGFEGLTYSFDHEDVHFISLDSDYFGSRGIINDVQRDWLEKDLEKNKKSHVFAFYHEPAYPIGGHLGTSLDKESDERDRLWAIIDKYNIDAVFNGHEHHYSRLLVDKKIDPAWQNAVYQIVVPSAGERLHDSNILKPEVYIPTAGGYVVVDVKENESNIKAFDSSNHSIDEFVIIRNLRK